MENSGLYELYWKLRIYADLQEMSNAYSQMSGLQMEATPKGRNLHPIRANSFLASRNPQLRLELNFWDGKQICQGHVTGS